MQDWSDGYMTEVAYTFGYYPELNPLRARLALLEAGIVPPEFHTACELGFGQGMSVNIHGAASSTQWHGTDFNPSQVGFARELAQDTPLAANLSDEAFEDFCRRDDLPQFDLIALHGIWSWISDANRAVIANFIERKLKAGGVVYVSYNTQPGWAAVSPLTELMAGFDAASNPPGIGPAARIDAALDFADKLMATGAVYGKANPQALEHLKRLRGHDRRYLAHEYFNRDWLPMSFARMRGWMEGARLQYATSAHYLDHVPMLNLSAAQQELLAGIPDAGLRETARDFIVNRLFRRDYWVRGARRLAPAERAERLRAQRVILAQGAAKVKLKVSGIQGEATLHEDVYRPILDALADHRPRSLGEIEQLVAARGIHLARIVEAVMILAGTGAVHPAQPEQAIAAAAPHTARLNARLCAIARYSEDVNSLASPVSGGAIQVGRIEQLFLLALGQGKRGRDELADFTGAVLAAQGHRILRDGKPLGDAEQMQALRVQAGNFETDRLPVLRAFGISS
ncbi:class I SAM-dependent methyltransferase [Telluria beijingensis]|uniref:class I SAM-dependent methyltransferase n=1 Tax=Telluria beijingensis TaxID=3068633 RepID=UPI00279609D0|nr:class I SAM-dependent methyltransferase [Massilia sp. REN29]